MGVGEGNRSQNSTRPGLQWTTNCIDSGPSNHSSNGGGGGVGGGVGGAGGSDVA